MTEPHIQPDLTQHGSRRGGHSWMMALMMRGMNHGVGQSADRRFPRTRQCDLGCRELTR